MPSLNEIYASLIENPDIQPPEGQDREAYVVDLAEQRLRQFKNNEKALSLGMQKTAIESLSDYVLTPLRKSMPTTPIEIFADFLQLAIDWDDIMDENAMNSIINSVDPQIANAVLSQYSAKDLKTEDSRVQVLAEMAHLQLHNNARLEDAHEKQKAEYEQRVKDVQRENKRIERDNEGKPDNQKRPPMSAGNPPTKPKDKSMSIPGKEISSLVNKKLDNLDVGPVEDLIDPSKKGGKRFREWGDEASWIKHIGYEQPPIAKPSQATEPQKDDEKGIAEKGWQILNSRIQDKLRYHFKDMYPSKDWDNFDINSPEHNDIMNDIVTDDRAAKDIKDILNETGRIDGKHVPEYDKFMSDGFGSKFFEVRSELYDGGRDEQDGVRTLIGEHFKGKKLTSASLTRMSTKALRDIFNEAGYSNAENLHPAYMKNIVAQIFPSNITNPGQFELARDKQAEKVSSKWTTDNLNQLYAPKALTFLRESFPEMTDDDLVKLAQTENAHDDSPNKGNIGGTNAKGRSVRLNLQTVRNTKFQNRHAESFGLDPVEEVSTPSRKLSAVYDGINEDRVFSTRGGKENKFNWDGESRDSRDHFNTWRQNALDQFVADTGTFGMSEQTQVLDDLFKRVSEDTGLPLSLVRIGSDENSDSNTMTAEMRQAIYNSMRSNIILHAERKGIPNREVAEGKEPDHTAKPLDVNPEDLAAHYTNGMNESLGYTDNIRETMKRIQARIDANDYPDTDQQGLGASRGADQAYLAKLRLREPRQEGIDMRQELREESGDYGYEFPAESGVRELQNARDVDAMMGAVKDQKRTPKKKDETPSAPTTRHPIKIKDTGSAVDKISDEAKKRQEEDQARKDKEDAAGNEEKSDGPTPIQWQGGDNYGTSLSNDQFVRDTNDDLYVVRSKKGFELALDGIDEEGNSRSSGNRTVNVDPSSAEYDKENEYFRHEIDGQSTRYNLFRVNSGKEPLQINESNEENMGKDEEGDPLPAISDEVQDYLKEAGKSAEEIKALFDTGELHDGDGNPVQLQTIKEQFPMEQPEGGEESTDSEDGKQTSEASGMENIKNIITESDDIEDSVKEKVRDAKNIKEINTAVSRVETPVNIEAIPSLPLSPAALTEAMRVGLFDLEGNPTPRGEHFLNMVGEAMPDIQEMVNSDEFKNAYMEKYSKTRFNPIRSLSKAALSHIVNQWDNLEGQADEDKIHFGKKDTTKWDQETTTVTKANGDPVDDNFYTKEFTFGDDAPHLKKAMWGNEESDHNVFSRMLMAGIVAGRLGNDASKHWEELMKEGSVFKGMISQVNGDDVSGQAAINNDDLNTDKVVTDIEDFAGGIPSGEEGENFISDVGVVQNPQPNPDDFAGGVPAGDVVISEDEPIITDEDTEEADTPTTPTVTADTVGTDVKTTDDKKKKVTTDDDLSGGSETREKEEIPATFDRQKAIKKLAELWGEDVADIEADYDPAIMGDAALQHLQTDVRRAVEQSRKDKIAARKKASEDAEAGTVEAPKKLDREQYYEELAKHDEISVDEARKRYGDTGAYDDAEFLKKLRSNHNRKPNTKETDDLDRDGMLDRIAELRGISKEEAERKYEHHDDKEIRQALHGQINQEASREAADKKTEEARVGKQNARDANASLKHQFKTPMEVKNEFDPDREGAGEDGEMSTSEAADMFRSLLQHASQNHHHYDEAGIERLNELNHNLVRHLERSPEGLEELDKIHSEVQMASDLDVEYGSQDWYDHLEKTEADRAEKETREREDAEAEEAEATRKFDDRETALDRAFAHPHHKDHSNRLHSFDLEIEIGEDGKPTVTNAEHKGGIHHFEHSDGVVRENEHDASSHRGSGRSEHAPHDPDHTPEQAEAYQKIHAHRQRMDDLESPIRETERRHSKEKSDLQRKFDEASKKRAKSHGRRRTGIQDKMHKQHSELTEAYDKDMESLSADLDDVTGSNQDMMDALREEKKAEHRELRSRHDRNASTAKERMDASESAINDQHGIHAKELEDLDAEHEQDRADFDAGTGRWDLDEMQRTNPEAAARYADPEQREAVKEEMYNRHASTRAELENTHADRMENMEAFHAENISSHEKTIAQHADEQDEFERTSKDDVQKLQGEIVRATKEIREKINSRTDEYKEASDKVSAEANDAYEKLDQYVDATEAEYQAEHDTNKESLATTQDGEHQEVSSSVSDEYLEGSKTGAMLEQQYLDLAGDDEVARKRLTSNLDNSDLGATENSHAKHAGEESERIQGEAQEAAQGMMDEDTPPPGSPSPTNPSLVYKPGPGKNWVTRDSYNAAVAKGLLARDNNAISFSNQGGTIIAHHGTDSWEVSEGVEGKGARTSQEAIGNAIHHGASQWTDEDGTSFADKTAALKEGESFEISNDHFSQHSPALVRGFKGEKVDGTTSTTDDTPTETGETPEEPKESSTSKFLGRMGTKVFSPMAQAVKQEAKKAKQNFANDLRSNRWQQNNMFATGEGTSKRYQEGYTWYGKPKNIDPDKDHVGQASLSRELQRFNPFKGQKAKAEISTENQIENRSRHVQALQTHVQGQNSTLRQMGAQSSPTVKPTVGASTQTLKDHVQNKQNTGTTTPAPPA